MCAAFEHSWRLLTPPEQQVLMRLSVFRGFSSAVAGDVADATPAILRALADKSLLHRMPSGRYEMHELLRRYAGEKLAATPTADEIRDRHCTCYTTFLHQQEAVLAGADAARAVAAIKGEHPRSVAMGGNAGRLEEIAWNLGNYPPARLEQALDLARATRSRRTEADTLLNLGRVSWHLDDYHAARGHPKRAWSIYREIGDRQSESLALACLCLLAHHLGDDETAHQRCLQALRIARKIGNRRVEGYVLTHLGHALVGLGHLAEATEIYRQALTL